MNIDLDCMLFFCVYSDEIQNCLSVARNGFLSIGLDEISMVKRASLVALHKYRAREKERDREERVTRSNWPPRAHYCFFVLFTIIWHAHLSCCQMLMKQPHHVALWAHDKLDFVKRFARSFFSFVFVYFSRVIFCNEWLCVLNIIWCCGMWNPIFGYCFWCWYLQPFFNLNFNAWTKETQVGRGIAYVQLVILYLTLNNERRANKK